MHSYGVLTALQGPGSSSCPGPSTGPDLSSGFGAGPLSSSRVSKTMEPPLSSPTQAFRSRGREELVEIYITARFEY